MSEGSRIATFKDRLLGGKTIAGTFLKTPVAVLGEILGQTSLDVICIDAEHAPFDRLTVDSVLANLRLKDMPSLVRIPSPREEHLLSALDSGATGILVPHITSAKQAADMVQATHYGRKGRGFAGSTRAAGFGSRSVEEHLNLSSKQTVFVAQIEDVEAVDAIDEILAVDGVDAFFIGRMDLMIALGETSANAKSVMNAVETIVDKSKKSGRTIGMFTPTVEEAVAWKSKGVSFFLLGSDQGFIINGANALARKFEK